MRRVVGPVVVLLLAGGLLAGCSAASDTSGDRAAGSVAEAPPGLAGEGKADGAAVAGAASTVDRQIVTSGSVLIVVADPAAAAQRASELVESADGRVDERVEQAASDEQEASAHLVVRIPSPQLTQTLKKLKALGDADRVQLNATDVTDAAQDLDARISALKVSVARLETLMASATSSADLLAIESALSSRQADLEAKQAERSGLAGQVALATITLDLVPEGTVVTNGPSGFWSAIAAGWAALLRTLKAVTIAVGVLLPWAAFSGVLGAGTLVVVRVVRRRRAQKPAVASLPAPVGEQVGADRNPADPAR